MENINYCKFTQCIRCDMYWHDCKDDCGDWDLEQYSGSCYCVYCGHCGICGCCGNCDKPECEEEHI